MIAWPSMFIDAVWGWWREIMLGLTIEFVVVWVACRLPALRAAFADLLMNLASGFVGIPILIVAILLFERVVGAVLHSGPEDGVTALTLTYMFGIAVNTAIEALVLDTAFEVQFSRRRVLALAFGNAASAGLVYLKILHVTG